MNTTALGYYFSTSAIACASVNIILGFPLNCYVIWLTLSGARESLASDFFPLNLAVTEILISLSCTWYFVFQGKVSRWFCFEAFMFSRGLYYTTRPLFQSCMCVDCYIGVVHPVLFLRFKPLRYRAACSCVVWLISLVSCIYTLYTYSYTQYLYGFFVENLLVFFVTLFCCLSIIVALKRPKPGEKATEKKTNAMKRRALKIVLLITISMFVNFFLYVAVIPLQGLLTSMEFSDALTIATSLALLNGFIQPLLYLQRNGKLLCFRKP